VVNDSIPESVFGLAALMGVFGMLVVIVCS
jgi:hypothetical protein